MPLLSVVWPSCSLCVCRWLFYSALLPIILSLAFLPNFLPGYGPVSFLLTNESHTVSHIIPQQLCPIRKTSRYSQLQWLSNHFTRAGGKETWAVSMRLFMMSSWILAPCSQDKGSPKCWCLLSCYLPYSKELLSLKGLLVEGSPSAFHFSFPDSAMVSVWIQEQVFYFLHLAWPSAGTRLHGSAHTQRQSTHTPLACPVWEI